MTGETERSPSGWTPDTLKVLEDEKIAGLERLFTSEVRRIDEAVAASERAVGLLNTANQIAQDKFEATVERDSVKQNEFRGALDDLSKTMATRRELEATFATHTARLDEMAKTIGDLRSRLDVGPAALAVLQHQADEFAGRRAGVGASVNVIVIAATLLLSVFGLIIALYIGTR